jgi:hypothetical protein
MTHEDQGTAIGFGIVTLGILSSLVLSHSSFLCFFSDGQRPPLPVHFPSQNSPEPGYRRAGQNQREQANRPLRQRK